MNNLPFNKRPLAGKFRRYFWVLLFATYSVGAAGVMIDVLADEYRHLSQVAAVYRASSGAPFSTLPPGSTFKVVWPDGSSEYVMVVSASSGSGVHPIAGTQSKARPAANDATADASQSVTR